MDGSLKGLAIEVFGELEQRAEDGQRAGTAPADSWGIKSLPASADELEINLGGSHHSGAGNC